jgi:hypothetical protein
LIFDYFDDMQKSERREKKLLRPKQNKFEERDRDAIANETNENTFLSISINHKIQTIWTIRTIRHQQCCVWTYGSRIYIDIQLVFGLEDVWRARIRV